MNSQHWIALGRRAKAVAIVECGRATDRAANVGAYAQNRTFEADRSTLTSGRATWAQQEVIWIESLAGDVVVTIEVLLPSQRPCGRLDSGSDSPSETAAGSSEQ